MKHLRDVRIVRKKLIIEITIGYYGVRPHGKEVLSRYALAPWGMQPNTSLAANFPRFPWAAFHSCLSAAYYTISGVFKVIGCGREY